MSLPASYLASRRYEGATLQHDRVEEPALCEIQERDVDLIFDVHRYKFLSAPQLLELWWPGRSERAGQRRLRSLQQAGYLDRFRPLAYRGSYPWTYKLAPGGHQLLQQAGHIERSRRFTGRPVYDHSYVSHDLQLNAWVLAYRRGAGQAFLAWHGETEILPPAGLDRSQKRLADGWSAAGLRDDRPRPIRPDAILELSSGGTEKTVFVEYDRTRRVDKNYDKFRRYDTFLAWWIQHHPDYGDRAELPSVLFICQDIEQREAFEVSADAHLTGHRWRPGTAVSDQPYPGRRHVLFADEVDAHEGAYSAIRLPAHPIGHRHRRNQLTRVWLPTTK